MMLNLLYSLSFMPLDPVMKKTICVFLILCLFIKPGLSLSVDPINLSTHDYHTKSELPAQQVGLLIDTTGLMDIDEIIDNDGFVYIIPPAEYFSGSNYWYRMD